MEVEGDANAAVIKQLLGETETTVGTGGHPQGEAAAFTGRLPDVELAFLPCDHHTADAFQQHYTTVGIPVVL